MDLNQLVEAIEGWAEERGILEYSNPHVQMLKTVSEVGELADELAKKNMMGVIDGIGDIVVTLIIQARLNKTNLQSCLAHAYQEIKDRRGQLVNGTFIKEG